MHRTSPIACYIGKWHWPNLFGPPPDGTPESTSAIVGRAAAITLGHRPDGAGEA
jgi:hypothetical protein